MYGVTVAQCSETAAAFLASACLGFDRAFILLQPLAQSYLLKYMRVGTSSLDAASQCGGYMYLNNYIIYTIGHCRNRPLIGYP